MVDCNDICCKLLWTSAGIGGGFEQTVHSLTLIALMLLSLALLIGTQLYWGKAPHGKIHYHLIIVAEIGFFLGVITMLLPFWDEGSSTVYGVLVQSLYVACISALYLVEMAFAFHMLTHGLEGRQERQSWMRAGFVVAPLLAVGLTIIYIHHTEIVAAIEEIIYSLVFMALWIVAMRPRDSIFVADEDEETEAWKDQPPSETRSMLLPWASYCLVTHSFTALTFVFIGRDARSMISNCSQFFSQTFFWMSWAVVFVLCIRRDRAHLHRASAVHLQRHYTPLTDHAAGANSTSSGSRGLSSRASSQQVDDPVSVDAFLDGLVRIHLDSLDMQEVIGVGQYGEVYRGYWKSKQLDGRTHHQREIAVKKFKTPARSTIFTAALSKEVHTLARLHHPNVLQLLGVAVQPQPQTLYMITEYYPQGSLFDQLHSGQRLTGEQKYRIICGVVQGMAYLHSLSPPIIHRDLKSPNLLLTTDFDCVVCDFGISRVKEMTTTMTQVGTPQWMAPEVLRGGRYSERADVFSFAVVLWELMHEQPPFPRVAPLQVAHMVAYDKLRLPISSQRVPPEVRTLIQRCWDEKPTNRPSFADIQKLLPQLKNCGVFASPKA